MHVLNSLDSTGHTSIEWETGTKSERRAREEFNQMVAAGCMAYASVTEEKEGKRTVKHEQIREFDPEAEQITIHRAFQGG